MIRLLSALVFIFALSLNAQAGDPPPPHIVPPPHPHPFPPPSPVPPPGFQGGFCDGHYEGYSFHQGPLALQIQEVGACGQVQVTMWWNGFVFVGGGVCEQTAPWQAAVNYQFPNAPMERAVVNLDRFGTAYLDGRVDFGDGFHLVRR